MNRGLLKTIFLFVVLCYFAIFLAYLSFSVKNKSNWCFCLDFQDQENLVNKVWTNLALFSGFYLFIHVGMVGFTRIFSLKIVPYIGEQPRFIMVFNRIISNTIEQLIIFGCLLFAAIQMKLFDWPHSYFAHLVRSFIFGRCFFSVGYILAELFDLPFLRSFGFALTIFTNGTLVLGFIGVDFFKVAGHLPIAEL